MQPNQDKQFQLPATPQLAGLDEKKETKKENKEKTTPVQEVQKWSSRYNTAKDYQKDLFKKWGKWYNDMYAHVENKRMAPWRSKVYMPIIASKVWDLISRFIQYRPGWEVSVRTLPVNTLSTEQFNKYMEVMSKRAERVRMKLEYDFDNPLLGDSIPDELLSVMLDAAVTGQGVARVPYLTKTSQYNSYTANGDMVNFGVKKTVKAQEGYNALQAVNVFNVFLMPGARSLQQSPWLIIHDKKPYYELERDTSIDQKALQNARKGLVTNEFAQYEAGRNRLSNTQDPGALDSTTNMVEIFECWSKETNECIIYAQSGGNTEAQWVELSRVENPYWHQKYPFVAFYIRRKPYQFFGESIFENSETMQAAVNDIFNHFMDRENTADGMLAIEESAYVDDFVISPAGTLIYRGERPTPIKFPQPDANNMNMAMNLINGAIENATISQYASGVPNSATDSTQGTATGVTRMMEAAAEKVGFMRANFRRSWREVGEMWSSNSQQFMVSDVIYDTTKNGETISNIIRPVDMIGIFGIKIDDGSFEPVSKDEKRRNFLDFVTNMQAWQTSSVGQSERTGNPADALRIDWNEIVMRGAEHFGENYQHFILPPAVAPQQQPGQPQQTPAPETPTPDMPPQAQAPAAIQPQVAPGAQDFTTQSDGKSMPDSFPVRSLNNPTLAG